MFNLNSKNDGRTLRLRDEVMANKGSFVVTDEADDKSCFLRDLAMYRAGKQCKPNGMSVVQRRALFLLELVKEAIIEIDGEWELAGKHLSHAIGMSSVESDEYQAKLREAGVENPAEVEKIVRGWGEGLYYAVGDENNEYTRGGGDGNVFYAFGWMENHSIRDYAKVLRIGFGGIKREIEAKLNEGNWADGEFTRGENFWKAGLLICDAGLLLGERYAQVAKSQGNDELAEICGRVLRDGVSTFFEAVQALWFAHILTCGEDGINANSLGRLDQILWPYYKADVEAGRLSRGRALEIMEEFACKLYLDYDVQAITLAGVRSDGSDAVNDLSYIILEATRNMGFIRDISVRITDDTPDEFLELCAELVIRGGGIPFFFNDNCFVKAMSDRGISVEDARDYAPIGCVELTIPGKANPHAVSGWINSTRCLELALFDGVNPRDGKQMGLKTGAFCDFESYEDFANAYRKQLEFFSKNMLYHINRGELFQREKGPMPCWSVLTDDCIERGRDITDGGAVYTYHSICFLGTANTADSLMAVKKLVFEDGVISKERLLEALRKNFEGFEDVRQMLLNGAAKYGNDVDEVDEIARWVTDEFITLVDSYRSALGGRYFVHLFSFLQNVYFGRGLGATPDGRMAGEPIAYSLSAQQGRDEEGVTALMGSLSKLPHDKSAGGSAAIIDIVPKVLEGEAGKQRLAQMIRSAFAMGVGQMQFNVVTEERLLQAKADPEKFGNIPVRVAGYSQIFKLLPEELQDHVIMRTKHNK